MKQKQLDVLLIRPPFTLSIYEGVYKTKYAVGKKKVDPPMALMQLATPLVKEGFKVKILDGEIEDLNLDQLVEKAASYKPLFIGITSTTPESNNAIEVMKRLKRLLPDSVYIFGGAHATHVPWEIVQKMPEVDYVVVYEGEKALLAICKGDVEKIKEYSENASILIAESNSEHLISPQIILGECQTKEDLENNIPCRDEEVIKMDNYMATDPGFGLLYSDSVETSRGCPFGCSFCSSAKSGLGIRSVENVLDELDLVYKLRLNKEHKLLVTFLDDTLTFNRERAIQIFEGIIRRNIKIRFRAFTRANTISTKQGLKADLEFVRLMVRSGSTALSFGVESGSQRILEAMNKGVTLDDYLGAYDVLQKAGFRERRGSFIVGSPYETRETIVESINFAKKAKLNRLGVNIMTPYPGTETYNLAREGKGIYFEKTAKDAGNYKRWGHSVISTPELSPDALVYWQKRFLTEINLSSSGMKFFASNILNGNFSEYYHQPTIAAIKSVKLLWNEPKFRIPDHSGYVPSDFGHAHLTKNNIIRVLNKIYGIGFSRSKQISKIA